MSKMNLQSHMAPPHEGQQQTRLQIISNRPIMSRSLSSRYGFGRFAQSSMVTVGKQSVGLHMGPVQRTLINMENLSRAPSCKQQAINISVDKGNFLSKKTLEVPSNPPSLGPVNFLASCSSTTSSPVFTKSNSDEAVSDFPTSSEAIITEDQPKTNYNSFHPGLLVPETLDEWVEMLEGAEVPEARLSVEHIVAHVLGVPRSALSRLSEYRMSEEQSQDLERLLTCRMARMPLQYVLGEWEFHCVTLSMRPPVFIPRQETEQLVELAIQRLQGIEEDPWVLEIGCGSGAISLALLVSLPKMKCIAIDHSQHAIKLTKENAHSLGLQSRLHLVEAKVTQEKFPPMPSEKKFDLIISNPPYVLRKDLLAVDPEIMLYEDLRALDGGKDGLDVIKPILLHSQHLMHKESTLLLEMDPCHQYLIPNWCQQQRDLSLKVKEVHKDFTGRKRFIEFVKS
ncbi:hemK methyltransferase 1 isoform X2 [Oratosquilla oratoria]|uniref:hemK methyltransferase 1 isoform X2 n=1 Tax=Oratosquilla oratoria TaxID=337810 RepID=UPI003F769580